jgi:hypothetical protein
LIGNLRSMFPKARVIIAEIEDDVLGVSYHGPVRRLLDAGAETPSRAWPSSSTKSSPSATRSPAAQPRDLRSSPPEAANPHIERTLFGYESVRTPRR